jgi:hypothetical protein
MPVVDIAVFIDFPKMIDLGADLQGTTKALRKFASNFLEVCNM